MPYKLLATMCLPDHDKSKLRNFRRLVNWREGANRRARFLELKKQRKRYLVSLISHSSELAVRNKLEKKTEKCEDKDVFALIVSAV